MNEKSYGLKQNVIAELQALAKEHDLEKLVLFGSRARGDYKDKSDVDLAFFGGDASRFIIDVHEEVNTLLSFDVVDLERPIQPELREAIERDGVVLYEKI